MSPIAMPIPATSLRTSDQAVRLLEPYCVPPYFSRESYANVLKAAEALPTAISLSHMFERPLDAPHHPVDFFLWISSKGRRDVLAGLTEDIPASYYSYDSWARIRHFARGWLDKSSPLHEVCSVWLEFDIRGEPKGVPTPLIFFTVEPHVSPEPALTRLQPRPFTSPQLATFRRCWEAIPSTTRYRTAGILYSRPTEAIRLILVMAQDEAFHYLERVGWPGSPHKLRKRVEKFLQFHGEVALHIDVHPQGVEPQVGLEIYVDQEALYRGRGGRCEPLLDVAVHESLCVPEVRDALAAWPGSQTVHLPDNQTMRVDRMFHHLKVVSQPDLRLQAKAYTTAEYEVLS